MRRRFLALPCRSASKLFSSAGFASPLTTRSSFHARFRPSWIPVFIPCPPTGLCTCEASPMRKTRSFIMVGVMRVLMENGLIHAVRERGRDVEAFIDEILHVPECELRGGFLRHLARADEQPPPVAIHRSHEDKSIRGSKNDRLAGTSLPIDLPVGSDPCGINRLALELQPELMAHETLRAVRTDDVVECLAHILATLLERNGHVLFTLGEADEFDAAIDRDSVFFEMLGEDALGGALVDAQHERIRRRHIVEEGRVSRRPSCQ